MYADDTVIYYSHKNIEQIEEKLQVDFTNITSWLKDNQLVINLKKGKTEAMLFGTEKRLSKALSTLVRFRLKTHTFRSVLAFRPH